MKRALFICAALMLACGSSSAPPPPAPTIASFTASPPSITPGGSSTLSWSVSDATSLSIDQGIGVVTGTSHTVSPSATTIYTLTATGAGGSTTASAQVTVTPPAPVIAAFSATPASVAAGQSSTLAWSVTGATSLSIDQGVGAVTGSSVSVSPSATTTYTLTATGPGGTATKQATVTILAPPGISSFTATPATISPGGSSTLTWSVTGASAISIDHGVGAVTGFTAIVSPSATTTYTLTATGPGGSATKQVTVTVTGSTAPVIASFTAAPASVVAGNPSTLSWSVSGANSLAIDHGVGTVTGTSTSVSPSVTTTYTLTATGTGGTATAQTTVTVTAPPPPPPVISSFGASPTPIAQGESSTLSWSVTNATSLSIDQGVGAVTGNSTSVSPSATTTYTLTATGGGGSATAQTTVTVLAPGTPLIRSFAASPANIAAGGSAVLSWSVAGANSLSIDQGVGVVTGATKTVTPAQTLVYTLTAVGSSTNATATATVHVLRLQYTDPAAGGSVRLVNDVSSTGTHVVLNLVLGASGQTAFGVALDLPLDATKVSIPAGLLITSGSQLLPTANAQTAALASVPSTGPLAGVLVLGVAHRKTSPTDLDQTLAPAALLAQIAFDLPAATPASGVVFDGATPGAKFNAALLSAGGAQVVSKSGFAIGKLFVGE